jgi:hypothetical protein
MQLTKYKGCVQDPVPGNTLPLYARSRIPSAARALPNQTQIPSASVLSQPPERDASSNNKETPNKEIPAASKIRGLSVSRDSSPPLGAELLRSSSGSHHIGARFLGVLFMEAVDGFDLCEVVLRLPSRVRVSSPPNEIL